ncbi:RagB/SusD family nutrient uptake outer membrane protein [uncultured Bacteroides sp.]|uniref:RagB/SusD family nutrient uptake outer membrane protein n=1 Tax=uncultured Bacteroides sp. TaxID=162156 RepID=UPI0025DD3D8D|nr:RagB/SusD family nutrient uptake outer membrane protein [uncultured Bacteroides sp.]
MKRYNKITGVLAVATLSLFSACSEDAMDRINKDHDHTTSVAARFILADVITSTAFSNSSGDLNTYASAYVEYEVGVDNQLYYAEVRENEPTSSSTYNNVWNGIYSSLKNARIIINQCSEGGIDHGNDLTKGMAEVMAAYNCALLTDFFGNAPCSQAALVDENGSPVYLTPKMDTQQEIYAQIMTYLDDAIVNLQKSDLADVSEQDFLYGGDAAKWLKFAYGLKARYTMRQVARSSNLTTDMENVLDYVSKSFESADDQAAFDIYDANNINPFYGFYTSRAGLGASQSLCEKLIANDDLRAARAFFSPVANQRRTQVAANDPALMPAPNGTPEQSTSRYGISAFMYAKTAPTLLLSYHELMFLKAEALCRLGRDAEDALKEAVVAGLVNAENSISIAIRELGSNLTINNSNPITEESAGTYFDDVVKARYTAAPLQETMTQKYFALWGTSGEATETYNDIRRMRGLNENFISLSNPNTSKFPLRYPYGNSDTTANPEVKAAYGDGSYVYTESVWWAGGTR